MEKLLAQLGDLFIGAIPSGVLLILLFFYLRAVLFGPLDKILEERHAKTGGREQKAAEMLRRAEQRMLQYSASLQAAKSEIYAGQDELRRKLEAERDAAVALAAEEAKTEIAAVRNQLDEDVAEARRTVETEAQALANSIADKVLEGATR
jgi:F-type H+-transporting ATPase subunit b